MEKVKKDFPNGLPKLADLAILNAGKDVPPETAWIWGKDDELGRINLLTPEVVRAAQEKPSFHRAAFKHSIEANPLSTCIFDDIYDLNTQSGSQWDGFRHFGHLGINKMYNNLDPNEIHTSTRCGIQAIAQHGIAGRGILLDYYSWIKKQGRAFDPVAAQPIPLADLKAVAKAQNVEFRQGDILLIRSGYISRYYELEKEDPALLTERSKEPCFSGVEQSEEMKEFLHDTYFAAVGGDAPAFEVWPPKAGYYLHEYLLALWGCIIGEMLDLEACHSALFPNTLI
ncbi:hypothetical protein CMQ_4696 [Grosmannia clavigera kw1407]|uniref:Cyclase family protein n=1 Tax=Grosmannia clavigera (strain kw1407 / UAMH 11150) TaxID=655863 RepID=F0XU87_GROCL|nr:uncharacterized protein CMQ_4696 [Grosmannia clavigera kw1407]EFW98844.1 hypothetical protein CMQ_4696 [Grosmannia clavigera kw1407]